jgi:hypothetical protein
MDTALAKASPAHPLVTPQGSWAKLLAAAFPGRPSLAVSGAAAPTLPPHLAVSAAAPAAVAPAAAAAAGTDGTEQACAAALATAKGVSAPEILSV